MKKCSRDTKEHRENFSQKATKLTKACSITCGVVSFVAGYGFKDGSAAELDVGGKKFNLFTKDDTAWARDAATDKAIVDAMLKGKQAVIKGGSARGTATTDTYTLAGFPQVLAEIDKACKVKR